MKTVLIVDDEFAILETMADILSWDGYEVATASNGRDGLAEARTRRPALILVDYMMPLIDGMQMLSQLRGDPDLRAVPVVIMTAAPLRLPASKRTWQGLLLKPFDADQLRSTVHRLIGGNEAAP